MSFEDSIEIVSGDAETDSDGQFTCNIIIPESAAGEHDVAVTDESGNKYETVFRVKSSITITPDSAVPGNLVGFYLFGYIMKKKFSWSRFIIASEITLSIANMIVAFLYIFIFKILYLNTTTYVEMSLETQIFFSLGLTVWWYVTMLPFVLLITPFLIRATARAFPTIVPKSIREKSVKNELPKMSFCLALLIPGITMLIIGLATTYTIIGTNIASFFGETTSILIQTMFYVSGLFLSILGIIFYANKISNRDR